MNTNLKKWKWVTFILLLAFVLVACGGEDPTATPVPEEPTPVPEVAEEQPAINPADYQNIPWMWVSFSDSADGAQDISEPDRYQIVLNDDGTISVQADCNMVSGTYSVDGSSISIELGPSTMAACPSRLPDRATCGTPAFTPTAWMSLADSWF